MKNNNFDGIIELCERYLNQMTDIELPTTHQPTTPCEPTPANEEPIPNEPAGPCEPDRGNESTPNNEPTLNEATPNKAPTPNFDFGELSR